MLDRASPYPRRRHAWSEAETALLMALRADHVPPKEIARQLHRANAATAMAAPMRTPASIRAKIGKLEGKGPRRPKLSERVSFLVTAPLAARAAACRDIGVNKAAFNRRCFELGLEVIASRRAAAGGAT